MDIVVAINGFGNWNKYTEPCLESIYRHEPSAFVICIDNNSHYPYPPHNFPNVQTIRTPRMSYAGMMNFIPRIYQADWYLILNNDTTCTGSFLRQFEIFDKNTNYGCRMLADDQNRKFIETWMIIFSHQSWLKIGPWDENFKDCGFEDADWGWRATAAGVNQEKIWFPFIHGGGSRFDDPSYSAQRLKNMHYLIKKHGGTGRMHEV